jgi:threonine dehydrogenase-like Zn-dependent dehydrogenase
LDLGKQFGADLVLNSRTEDSVAAVRDLTGGRGADIVLECSGAAPAVDQAIRMAKRFGKAVGIHCPNGATAARRLAEGFNYVSIANDLMHIEQAARSHLAQVTGEPVRPS